MGRTKPLSTLNNVVLPAPLGPIRPKVPESKVTVMPSSGVTPPNRTVRSVISIIGPAPEGPCRLAPAPLARLRGGAPPPTARPPAARGPWEPAPRGRPAQSAAPAAHRRRTG